MKLGIGEILEKGSRLEGEAQLEFMRANFSPALGKMIEYALEPEYQWDLPPGRPPFQANKFLDQEGNMYNQVRRMYIFFAPNPALAQHGGHVSPFKKETNFVQMLENLTALDAEVLLHAKEKKLPFGYTCDDIRRIYPGLIYPDTQDVDSFDLSVLPDPVIDEVETTSTKKASTKSKSTKTSTAKKPATKRPAAKKPAVKKSPAKKAGKTD